MNCHIKESVWEKSLRGTVTVFEEFLNSRELVRKHLRGTVKIFNERGWLKKTEGLQGEFLN